MTKSSVHFPVDRPLPKARVKKLIDVRRPRRITFSRVEEVELSEVLNDGLLDRPLEREVKLLQGLAGRESRGFDATLATVALARGDLGAQEDLGEAFIAPLLLTGAGQRAPATLWRPPAPSVRGIGARAQTRPWSCQDQLDISGERADLDVDLVALTAPDS